MAGLMQISLNKTVEFVQPSSDVMAGAVQVSLNKTMEFVVEAMCMAVEFVPDLSAASESNGRLGDNAARTSRSYVLHRPQSGKSSSLTAGKNGFPDVPVIQERYGASGNVFGGCVPVALKSHSPKARNEAFLPRFPAS